MESDQSRIDLLPEHLIDQIKAGEVIERPGNLVKEILENSIDAGATKIELTIINNGMDLISLKDDGQGIHPQDLSLAFSRHATSKIELFEDLYRLQSFGFRGEALASIAAISKVQCISFQADQNEGAEIRIEGGLITSESKRLKLHPSQHGTELVIQDLFFNTPVRLKFIQSQLSEKNFIKKIIFSFIVAHPEIEFVLKFDQEEKEIYSSTTDLLHRILDLIPKSKGQILHQTKEYESNKFEIYLIPSHFRSPSKLHYLLINKRFITDKQLFRIIDQALLSTFGTNDFYFVAELKLPPENVDVNVHPNKTIIKIFESSKVIALITGTIKEMGAMKMVSPTSEFSSSKEILSDLLPTEAERSSDLSSTKQNYNWDGIFSPHRTTELASPRTIWFENYFIHQIGEQWLAVNALRLLDIYVQENLKNYSTSIPLLVSEPFKISKSDPHHLSELQNKGIELERLSTDTLVLRSVPLWLNGFPLKEIINRIIQKKNFNDYVIVQQDWPISSWEKMLTAFPILIIIEKKIAIPLKELLKEKLP